MTNLRFKLGILHIYALILIQILYAFTVLLPDMNENQDTIREIIFQVSYIFFYVSIFTLIKRLTFHLKPIRSLISWIIRLEILRTISAILVLIKYNEIIYLQVVLGLTLFVFYIILIVNIFSNRYAEHVEIASLRPFFSLLILGIVLAAIIGIYLKYNHHLSTGILIDFISVIPFALLIDYFVKMKKIHLCLPQSNHPPQSIIVVFVLLLMIPLWLRVNEKSQENFEESSYPGKYLLPENEIKNL
jgi:hypothetical protein